MDVSEPENPYAIRTVSNRIVDPWHLQPDDVNFYDIAQALSLTNRFMGQTASPFSVAAHSLWVLKAVERILPGDLDTQLAALLHDASEAYLCDIPSPLKRRPEFAAYREAEHRAQNAIAAAANLDPAYFDMPEVKDADFASYVIEREHRFDYTRRPIPARYVRDQFWDRYSYLQLRRKNTP